MAKKSKKPTQRKTKKSASFKVDFGNLKELMDKRELIQKLKEKSELENEVLESESPQDSWTKVPWSEAPSLGKTASAPIIITLGQRRVPTEGAETNEETNPNKYKIGGPINKDDVNYIPTTLITRSPEVINISEIGKTRERNFNQEAFTSNFSEMTQRNITPKNIEQYRTAERFNTKEAGRKDPLKKEDKKYEFKQSGA